MFNYPIGKGGMPPKKMAKAPVANPADADEMHAGEDDEPDVNDKPVHTEHHPEGHHLSLIHICGAALSRISKSKSSPERVYAAMSGCAAAMVR